MKQSIHVQADNTCIGLLPHAGGGVADKTQKQMRASTDSPVSVIDDILLISFDIKANLTFTN